MACMNIYANCHCPIPIRLWKRLYIAGTQGGRFYSSMCMGSGPLGKTTRQANGEGAVQVPSVVLLGGPPSKVVRVMPTRSSRSASLYLPICREICQAHLALARPPREPGPGPGPCSHTGSVLARERGKVQLGRARPDPNEPLR